MAALIARLDQIVALAMQHPKQVLQMTVSQTAIDNSGTLAIEFRLSSIGTETTDAINPVDLVGGSGLSVRGWPDKPPAQFQADEVFGIDADGVTESGNHPASAPARKLMHIPPGKERLFRMTARLRVPASQSYLIQLVYQNTDEYSGGTPVIVGELFSKPIKLRVTSMSR